MGRFDRTADDDHRVCVDWITDTHALPRDAFLLDAVKLLRAEPSLRVIAVVDRESRPVGALFERDLRPLLFSPFGYALLSNRSLAIGLSDHLRPCPAVAIGCSVGDALDAWRAAHDAEGLILTGADGCFAGVVDQPALLRLAAASDRDAGARRVRRADRIERASRRFEEEARRLAGDVSDASASVAQAAVRMSGRAEAIGARSADVAAAAAQTATSLGEIARGGHAFSGAMEAVETAMTGAQDATQEAVARTRRGAAQVAALVQAADSIGSVTSLIDTIARQTTMLALNAAIEAARAGHAGRGFTSVAHEVKSLADQTRVAAAGIAGHVQRIRGAIDDVSDGHVGVAAAVGAVETLSVSVVDAVRAHGAAGRAIGTGVDEAGLAARAIGGGVTTILDGARDAEADAAAMRGLADGLAGQARALEGHLVRFLGELQAA